MATPRRFTSLDLAAAVHELQAVVGTHLQNVYDVDARTFILKFGGRTNVLIESGIRLHATGLAKENPNVLPSGFAARLRKGVRDRRCTGVRQLGFDRVAEFAFGHDARPEAAMYLYVELYVAGNIVLCDYKRSVVALLREVSNPKTGEKVLAPGLQYTAPDSAQGVFETSWDTRALCSVKNALKSLRVPPLIADGAAHELSIDLNAPCATLSEAHNAALKTRLEYYAVAITNPPAGFYCGVTVSGGTDYAPLALLHLGHHVSHPSFGAAVDAVFHDAARAAAARLEEAQRAKEQKKVDAIRSLQEARIAGLRTAAAAHVHMARLVQGATEIVRDACRVVSAALQNGVSWDGLADLVAAERARGRPLAHRIVRLELSKALVYLDLRPEEDLLLDPLSSVSIAPQPDESSDAPPSETSWIADVDYRLTPSANAQRHYGLRDAANEKLARSLAAFDAAMASAEAHVRAAAREERRRARAAAHQALIPKRKAFWFERFRWFVSSDGLLVLAGRDAHQNEVLVKRVLRDGDAYIHADVHGAASVVVKAFSPTVAIPPRTLAEAGALALCYSRAWEAKIVTSAWWVHAGQVSKTAPSGEYLATGSFVVRGRKNFLPPAQLVLGFAVVFVLDAESAERRRKIRLEKPAETAAPPEPVDESYLQLISPEVLFREEPSVTAAPQSRRADQQKKGRRPEKYADQDPEERRIRQALLGNAPQSQQSAVPEDDDADLVSADELAAVDAIAVCPGPEDVVVNVIPMAAPYAATHACRFRVKLVPAPGGSKRGVASKTALALMAAHPENGGSATQRERALLKSIPDAELALAMPPGARLASSGVELSKAKKAVEKEKRSTRKHK